MKKNKTLVLGTVLAAAGVGVVAGQSEAHADSVYTVQKGDTVYKISRKFAGDTSLVKGIVKVNKLSNPDLIYVGQKVTVPTEGSQKQTPKTVASTKKTYVAPKTTTTVKTTYKAPKSTYVAPKAQTQTKSTYVAPKAQTQTNSTYVAPKAQTKAKSTYVAPKAQTQTKSTYVAPKTTAKKATSSNLSSGEASAKAWIAMKESTNNYNARNGQYIGKYQLSSSYLNGDYSAANQERVAEKYVKERYGSWSAAKAFHQANGWY